MNEHVSAVSDAGFDEDVLQADMPVLVDFWAEWCGPCKMFGPVFEEVSDKNPDITFAKCDTEIQQELAAQFQIRSIPTLMVFKEGVIVFQQPGALPVAGLEELVGKIKELDMAEVRKEMEKEESKG